MLGSADQQLTNSMEWAHETMPSACVELEQPGWCDSSFSALVGSEAEEEEDGELVLQVLSGVERASDSIFFVKNVSVKNKKLSCGDL